MLVTIYTTYNHLNKYSVDIFFMNNIILLNLPSGTISHPESEGNIFQGKSSKINLRLEKVGLPLKSMFFGEKPNL